MGAKSVIFITGLCPEDCFYCPISPEKWRADVMYVNEERVYSVDELVIEVSRASSLGAGITGGEPLVVLDRVLDAITALKEHFGESFHIHLYTSGSQGLTRHVLSLWSAGLDEIRFHPVTPRAFELAEYAVRETGMDVGFEIPIAPGLEKWAMGVVEEASRIGAKFVNLNEMEFSERNSRRLLLRGLKPSRVRPYAVEGALEAARRVLEWAREHSSVYVHFCPVSFKDSVQLKNRMRRLAEADARWFEKVTEEGTVVWGELECREEPVEESEKCREGRVCLPPDESKLRRIAREKDCRVFLVEAYPTRNRMVLHEEEL